MGKGAGDGRGGRWVPFIPTFSFQCGIRPARPRAGSHHAPALVVFLGDHIDRGPDSRGVLEQVIAVAERRTLVPLVSNHEEMLLAALEGQSELGYWLKFGGTGALASYGYKG